MMMTDKLMTCSECWKSDLDDELPLEAVKVVGFTVAVNRDLGVPVQWV